MKKCVTLLCLLLVTFLSNAQWSNTSNNFYDSLAMPVVLNTGEQVHSIVVKSYPDSGYFVIWEDVRTIGNGADIYAQKYDKAGKALWAAGGAVVIAGVDNQMIAPPNVADYRYTSHACTDSANGFYIAWDDGNESASHSTAAHRVCAQHMLSNGTARFAYPGFVVAQPSATLIDNFTIPQLIADGNKGCFISYFRTGNYGGSNYGNRDVFVNCYRDDNGTMVSYGGGQADLNAEDKISNSPCGVNAKSEVVYPEFGIQYYFIYPDLQGGCNIVFSGERNAGGNERIRVGFNRLCRVKKESHVTVRKRTSDIAASEIYNYTYKKDSVLMLYKLKTHSSLERCTILGSDGTPELVEYTNYYVENFGNGFLNVSDLSFALEYVKGVMVPTDGNTNVNIIATGQRDYNYTSSSAGDWYKRAFFRNQEVYDSLPYQLTTDTTNPYFAYKLFSDKPLDKINYGDDTIMGSGVYDWDFALAASNNRVFAAGMVTNNNSGTYPRYVDLQQFQVDRIDADSFAVHYHTAGKSGVNIGSEISTSDGSKNIQYDNPLITTDQRGNALFSITDIGRSIRVSPIADSGRLVWGAMGKPIGTGLFNGQFYNTHNPGVAISPTDGTAVITWTDDRYIAPNSTGNNIYMRHLDSLNFYNYLPPQKPVNFLSYTGTFAFPVILTGTSLNWSYFEGYYSNGINNFVSTIAGIYDNFNLGYTRVIGLDNVLSYPVRTYNGKPYLDRNYTITPENDPKGAAAIDMRLYFTTNQFLALQKADPTIISPADLIVIKQPNTTGTVPSVYTPATGEERIVPNSWSEVDGGYYVQLQVSSFSNFFIEKNDGILPVTWLNVEAKRTTNNMVSVSWAVATESNVKSYLVQYSEDGAKWNDGCTVNANNQGKYSCTLGLASDKKYYFKVKETDLGGRYSISKTVWVDKLQTVMKFVISPNPVHQNAILNYTLPAASQATLKLVSNTGVIFWQQKTTLNTAGTLTIPTNQLSAGTYNLQIIIPTATQQLKIVKE